MRVAIVGLGSMGLGAACRLLRAPGLEPVGCDPAAAARERFAAAGGAAVARADALPPGLDAALVLTVTAEQARAALFGPAGCGARLAPGAVLIVAATMAPAEARSLAEQAGAAGLLYLDAPVSGGAAGAAAGALTVMAAGSDAAFAAAEPVLSAIARKVWRLGRSRGSAPP